MTDEPDTTMDGIQKEDDSEPNPTEIIKDVYIAEYDISPLSYQFKSAREDFVNDTASFLSNQVPGIADTEAKMFAEELLDEVFPDLLSYIEDKGFGLWLTFSNGPGKGGMDYPVYQCSPIGTFNSMQPSMVNRTKKAPSDEFFQAVSQLVEDEGDSSWGNIEQEVYEQLSDIEQELIKNIRNALIEGRPVPELHILVQYAQQKTSNQ